MKIDQYLAVLIKPRDQYYCLINKIIIDYYTTKHTHAHTQPKKMFEEN